MVSRQGAESLRAVSAGIKCQCRYLTPSMFPLLKQIHIDYSKSTSKLQICVDRSFFTFLSPCIWDVWATESWPWTLSLPKSFAFAPLLEPWTTCSATPTWARQRIIRHEIMKIMKQCGKLISACSVRMLKIWTSLCALRFESLGMLWRSCGFGVQSYWSKSAGTAD